jgi:hypothetical protein
MAVTTTADAVSKVVEVVLFGSQDLETVLAPFIESSANLLDDLYAGVTVSDATRELVERWLSAHFYKVFDPAIQSETVESLTTSYFGKVGEYLLRTPYGAQALALDSTGVLAAWQAKMTKPTALMRVGIKHVGTNAKDVE